MIITIIGWYGSETMGDRAILAGIFSFIKQYSPSKINIISLQPSFSERMVREDSFLWEQYCDFKTETQLIDVKNIFQVQKSISNSNVVIMGGGPLMDISSMSYIDYSFRYAKRKKVKTILFGVGVGPLRRKKNIKLTQNIIQNSDLVILRDKLSFDFLKDNCNNTKTKNIISGQTAIAIDPSLFICHKILKDIKTPSKRENEILINLRDFPSTYSENNFSVNEFVEQFVLSTASIHPGTQITLLPNHYFYWGGDDRTIMNQIKTKNNVENIQVQNSPLTLKETLERYYHAQACVGMRFHSIVFQTIMNGNNYILDYTGKEGKIKGLLHEIDNNDFYVNRFIDLNTINSLNIETKFSIEDILTETSFNIAESLLIKKSEVITNALNNIF